MKKILDFGFMLGDCPFKMMVSVGDRIDMVVGRTGPQGWVAVDVAEPTLDAMKKGEFKGWVKRTRDLELKFAIRDEPPVRNVPGLDEMHTMVVDALERYKGRENTPEIREKIKDDLTALVTDLFGDPVEIVVDTEDGEIVINVVSSLQDWMRSKL